MPAAEPTNAQHSPLNCPSCGAELPHRFRYSKMAACEYCDNVVYLSGAEATILGKQSALANYPSLLRLGGRFRYKGLEFEPVGFLRYDYGAGFWDEWWVLTDDGEGRWVSVDEGDFAIEEPVKADRDPPPRKQLQVGARLELLGQEWTVTETGHARLLGLRGELPEPMGLEREFDYVELSAPGAWLVTLEYGNADNQVEVYRGQWIDAFEIEELA